MNCFTRLPSRLVARFPQALVLAVLVQVNAAEPLRLHPDNPHYFLFRGKPMVIVTSGEHYGAVLNLEFDYARYLKTLELEGMNGTRLWVGAYCEPEGAFKIAHNTLAPAAGRFLAPWARSDSPGYANGGNRFDLSKWSDRYFQRLRDFVAEAGRRGVIVEVNLFCPFYEERMWQLSPMNPANNTSGMAPVAYTNVYTLDRHGGLLAVQEALVRKVATELNAFDNFYFELCNEPYFGGVTLDWQRHIADVIVERETALGRRHLISQNIANGQAKVTDPNPAISIFNFHYASPPITLAMNYGLGKVIGDNETGFRGTNDAPYRMEAWDFLLAGGGLFNNLDYSFTAGHEDGTFVFPADQPGGGTPALRRQLRFLAETLRSLDLIHARPEVVLSGVPRGYTSRVLAKPGVDYLVYLHPDPKDGNGAKTLAFGQGHVTLDLSLPPGRYKASWFNPRDGTRLATERLSATAAPTSVSAPAFEGDVFLRLQR